jgi:hypothetical protein
MDLQSLNDEAMVWVHDRGGATLEELADFIAERTSDDYDGELRLAEDWLDGMEAQGLVRWVGGRAIAV